MEDLTLEQQFRIKSLIDEANRISKDQLIESFKEFLYLHYRQQNLFNKMIKGENQQKVQEYSDIKKSIEEM